LARVDRTWHDQPHLFSRGITDERASHAAARPGATGLIGGLGYFALALVLLLSRRAFMEEREEGSESVRVVVGAQKVNHLVFLDARAGELEKILSGVKTMVVKEIDPTQTSAHPVSPGDCLYFLRSKGECAMRVKATVVRILCCTNNPGEDLSHILKEMQSRLQLTEDQYNHWSTKQQVLLIEFGSAHKISVIHVAPEKIEDRSGWTAFEDFSLIA